VFDSSLEVGKIDFDDFDIDMDYNVVDNFDSEHTCFENSYDLEHTLVVGDERDNTVDVDDIENIDLEHNYYSYIEVVDNMCQCPINFDINMKIVLLISVYLIFLVVVHIEVKVEITALDTEVKVF
jgi:hypothetical protein